jgi:hypothetical protein
MTTHDPQDPDSDPREGTGPGRRHDFRRRQGARKERVLHTRISDQLADDIRRMADELRVPVSNLVRNVLEEAFTVVETVTDNVGDLVEDVMEEAERARERVRGRRRQQSWRRAQAEDPDARPGYPEVIGWQPLIFNQPRACADCEARIGVGQRGFAGLTQAGLSSHVLCGDCMEARR